MQSSVNYEMNEIDVIGEFQNSGMNEFLSNVKNDYYENYVNLNSETDAFQNSGKNDSENCASNAFQNNGKNDYLSL